MTRRRIKSEILRSTVDYLEEMFGNSCPLKMNARSVASELEFNYPALFRGLPADETANLLIYRSRDRLKEKEKKNAHVIGSPTNKDSGGKKGKRKTHYGVQQNIFYGNKSKPECITELRKTNDASMSFEDREQIFSVPEIRTEISLLVSQPNIDVSNCCPGLLRDYRHLAGQFEWMTGAPSRGKEVEDNYLKQLNNLEIYVRDKLKDDPATLADLIRARERCDTELEGDMTFAYIMLLRIAGTMLDNEKGSDGAALFRLETDGPPGTSSPFIMGVEVGRSWLFKIFVEKT